MFDQHQIIPAKRQATISRLRSQIKAIESGKHWYDNHINIYQLAIWLIENDDCFWSAEDVLRLIEKPWQWVDEWEAFQRATNALEEVHGLDSTQEDMDV